MSATSDQTSPEPKPEPTDPTSPTGPSAAPTTAGASSSSDDAITPDILGEPWVARRIPVTESPTKAPGADHAVLAVSYTHLTLPTTPYV